MQNDAMATPAAAPAAALDTVFSCEALRPAPLAPSAVPVPSLHVTDVHSPSLITSTMHSEWATQLSLARQSIPDTSIEQHELADEMTQMDE